MSNYVKRIQTNDGMKQIYDVDAHNKIDNTNNNLNLALDGINLSLAELRNLINALNYNPILVSRLNQMTNTSRVYLYTGNESGGQYGYIYYYNGTEWVAGWSFESLINLDKTGQYNNKDLPISSYNNALLIKGAYNILGRTLNSHFDEYKWVMNFDRGRVSVDTGNIVADDYTLISSTIVGLQMTFLSFELNSSVYEMALSMYEDEEPGGAASTIIGTTPFGDKFLVSSGRLRLMVRRKDGATINVDEGTVFRESLKIYRTPMVNYSEPFTPLPFTVDTKHINITNMQRGFNANINATGDYSRSNTRRILAGSFLKMGTNDNLTIFSDNTNFQHWLNVYKKTEDGWERIHNQNRWTTQFVNYTNQTDNDVYAVIIGRQLDGTTEVVATNEIENHIHIIKSNEYNVSNRPVLSTKDFYTLGYIDDQTGEVTPSVSNNARVSDIIPINCNSYVGFIATYAGFKNTMNPRVDVNYYDENKVYIRNINLVTTRNQMLEKTIKGNTLRWNAGTQVFAFSPPPEAKYFRIECSAFVSPYIKVFGGDDITMDTDFDLAEKQFILRKVYNSSGKKSIAHRGFSSQYPENTMSALIGALKAGFDEFEVDIRKTRDGKYILMHDSTTTRTAVSGESYLVSDTDYDVLRNVNVGSLAVPEPPPDIDELFKFIGATGMMCNLELKQNFTENDMKEIFNKMLEYHVVENVYLAANNSMNLRDVIPWYNTFLSGIRQKSKVLFGIANTADLERFYQDVPQPMSNVEICVGINYHIYNDNVANRMYELGIYDIYLWTYDNFLAEIPHSISGVLTNMISWREMKYLEYLSGSVLESYYPAIVTKEEQV